MNEKIKRLENEKDLLIRQEKEKAEISIDQLKIQYEMEINKKTIEMNLKVKEFEDKIKNDKKITDEKIKATNDNIINDMLLKSKLEKEEIEKNMANEIDKLRKSLEEERKNRKLLNDKQLLIEKQNIELKLKEESNKKLMDETIKSKKELELQYQLHKEAQNITKLALEEVEQRKLNEITLKMKAEKLAKKNAEIMAKNFEKEQEKLKNELSDTSSLTPVLNHHLKPNMLWDPKDSMEIPLWSKILDPISNVYYYQNNFTGKTQWELPIIEFGHDLDSSTNNAISPIKIKTPMKTKSVIMNRNVAALHIQCTYRAYVARRIVRRQRGEIHSSLRPDDAEHFERWMRMNESKIIGSQEYWYDTVLKTTSWIPPTKEQLNEHENKMKKKVELNSLKTDDTNDTTDHSSENVLPKSLRERRSNGSKKSKLRRTLSIDTDTALQPQGVVTPYESPDNKFSEAKTVPNEIKKSFMWVWMQQIVL